MELKDYSTEELRAELKRRDKEARRLRALARKEKGVEYGYAEAIISYASNDPWIRRKFRIEFVDKKLGRHFGSFSDVPVDRKVFNKNNAPKTGDIVKVRCRKTNQNPTGFGLWCRPTICEMIKPKEQ